MWKARNAGAAIALVVAASAGPVQPNWSRCTLDAATEIFSGVAYGCERVPLGPEGAGILHWVQIDLSVPGVELYVTPLDPSAVAQGWQYRLRAIADVVDQERLAVAVNGAYFTEAAPWKLRLGGGLARGVETVVSNHVVSHLFERTHLLWFDDQLMPHLRPFSPPTPSELRQAKWGIGGLIVWLHDGRVSPEADRSPDARTAVAIDSERKLLFLAVAAWISPHLMLERLAELGARDGMLLDGGGSSAMAVGAGARQIPAGALYGGSRPVATFFGVRARPLVRQGASFSGEIR